MPATTQNSAARRGPGPAAVFGGLLLVAAVAAAIIYATPVLAAWAHSGRPVFPSALEAARAVGDHRLRGHDPAAAYPTRTATALPGATGFWTTASLLALAIVAALVAAGTGAAVVPAGRVVDEPGIVRLSLDGLVAPRNVIAAWHSERRAAPLVAAFVAAVAALRPLSPHRDATYDDATAAAA